MNLNNKEIIEGIANGDKDIFDWVFNNYYPGLCTFAQGYLKSEEAAKEVVQEIFLHLWENRKKNQVKTSLKAYLYRSVHNRCINYIRDVFSKSNKRIQIDKLKNQASLLLTDLPDTIFDKSFSEEIERELETAIDSLPEQCKTIFRLNRYENLSYREISDKLNVSLSTVKTQMSRAMQTLLKKMEKYLY